MPRASTDLVNTSGLSALAIASQEGHVDIVNALVNAGASRHIKTADGETALSLAEAGLTHQGEPGLFNGRCVHCQIVTNLQARAVVTNVVKRPELNGQVVLVQQWWPSKGRYSARLLETNLSLSGGQESLFRPSHLIFATGSVVAIRNRGKGRIESFSSDGNNTYHCQMLEDRSDEMCFPDDVMLDVPVVAPEREVAEAKAAKDLAKEQQLQAEVSPATGPCGNALVPLVHAKLF